MTWKTLGLLIDATLLGEIVIYVFLLRAMMWRYRDTRKLHMAARASLVPTSAQEPWYVKGADKLLGKWLN